MKFKKMTEQDLKVFVARWFQKQGLNLCFQEFQFIRRPDVLVIDFDENFSRSLYKALLDVPFDYLVENFTVKKFNPENIANHFNIKAGALKRKLNILVREGYLAVSKDGYRVIRTQPFLSRLVTVECKVKDWKQGLNQAVTYKMLFSQESYLALPKIYIKNVDCNQFRHNGIGLLSIDSNGKVKKEIAPKNKVKSHFSHRASISIAKSFRAKTLKQIQPAF